MYTQDYENSLQQVNESTAPKNGKYPNNTAVQETAEVLTQADSGAATSCCSPELTTRLGAQVFDRQVAVNMLGFDGSSNAVEQYTVLSLEFSGTNADGETTTHRSIVHAQIVPQCKAHFVLGADAFHDLQMIQNTVRRTVTFFSEDPTKSIITPYVSYDEVKNKQQFNTEVAFSHDTKENELDIANNTLLNAKDTFLQTRTSLHKTRITRELRDQRTLQAIEEDPAKFLRRVKQPYTMLMLIGLIRIGETCISETITEPVERLRDIAYRPGGVRVMWDTYQTDGLNLSEEQRTVLTEDVQTLMRELKDITRMDVDNRKLTLAEEQKREARDNQDENTAKAALVQ